MPPQFPEDDTGSLERARARLYENDAVLDNQRKPLSVSEQNALPHKWEENPLMNVTSRGKRGMHFAGVFFTISFIFFIISLGVAGYFLYFGGNSVSVNKVTIDIQGPSIIAGGDTVPLYITITNKNSVAIENATIEIDFPEGTRNVDDVLSDYQRFTENLGTLESGATVARSVKVILFGGAGEELKLPVSFSYGTSGSNSTFVKKVAYALSINSTPLSVSVDAPSEVVSGVPFTFMLSVHSNATMPLDNVVLATSLPFGFSVASSSLPFNNSSFLLGNISPDENKTITLTGTLLGQDSEKKTFHFTIGTAKTSQDQTVAVTYMTQKADVSITAPFITTSLSINGNTSANPVINSGGHQSVTVSYTNTLPTSVGNATIEVAISGSAIDYESIKTSNGFYRSDDHTVVFSRDTDPSLATLTPGASGIGTFTFSTLPPNSLLSSPSITFSTSVSGTRAGETNVTKVMNTSAKKTAKIMTTVVLSPSSLYSSGALRNTGPIPPVSNQATTYTIVWNVKNQGSAVAGGTMSALLPSYVSYTGLTSGDGFSYEEGSRTVSWSVGEIAQGGSTTGSFQISFKPSISQKGSAPVIVNPASFSGYDRFAGVQISATSGSVTTATIGDSGYIGTNAIVQ